MWLEGWNFESHLPDLWGGERDWRLNWLPMAKDLINHACVMKPPFKKIKRLALEDGRVEGHALTPSGESTRITTDCWTIINRKTLELTREHIPHPKTKEKPQWDGRRGTITIKSNPITAGWVTHKLENTYTTEVHLLDWRFWAPCQASQPGRPAMGGGIPRESDFEG